ncbi:MAG TPA: hypothetical protein VEX38_01280, partial [Fimbriimonadaceae bacterium]|nr:hypothetical protein [Fimbriimonadaceae bacterium]
MNFWGTRVLSIAAAIGGCFLLDSLTRGILGTYEQRLVVLAGLYVTLAVSLNLINGITGQFSIGHAAFYQVGAYVTGYLSVTYFAKGISIPAALSVFGWFSIPLPFAGVHQVGVIPWLIGMMFIGAVFAAVAGFFVGLPSLRLRGDYLAIVT